MEFNAKQGAISYNKTAFLFVAFQLKPA